MALDGQAQIGERPDGHDRDLLRPLAGEPDQKVDRGLGDGLDPIGQGPGDVAQAVVAVDESRRPQLRGRAHRLGRPQGYRDLGPPGRRRHPQDGAGRQVERHIAPDHGDGDDVEGGIGEGIPEGAGVVDAAVGVDDDGPAHGRRPYPRPAAVRTVGRSAALVDQAGDADRQGVPRRRSV